LEADSERAPFTLNGPTQKQKQKLTNNKYYNYGFKRNSKFNQICC
jgi:hypothetical protein